MDSSYSVMLVSHITICIVQQGFSHCRTIGKAVMRPTVIEIVIVVVISKYSKTTFDSQFFLPLLYSSPHRPSQPLNFPIPDASS